MSVMELIQDHTDDETIPVLQRRYLFCELQVYLYHSSLFVERDLITELSSSLLTDILTVSVQTRKYRMKSFLYLLKVLSPHNPEHISIIVSSLPQLVLCIKDSNKKIRSVSTLSLNSPPLCNKLIAPLLCLMDLSLKPH